jgi:hypothetical protein
MVLSYTQNISFLLRKIQKYFTSMLLVRCKDVIYDIFSSKTAAKKTPDVGKVKSLLILKCFSCLVLL